MIEIGTEAISMQEHRDGKMVTVEATAWMPKDGLKIDTEAEVDALMESRAKARALFASGFKDTIMGAIDSVVTGSPERPTEIMSKDIIGTRFENVYKRQRLKILVRQ